MQSKQSQPNSLGAWLRLLRVANLPSAIANILMGFLLVHRTWTPGVELLLLVGASSCLYLAGMVLNDVFDLKIDAQQRPTRPLPSGQIAVPVAKMVGFGGLLVGVFLAAIVGYIASQSGTGGSPIWRPGLVALLLAAAVVLYDGLLKRTLIAPVLMGSCRTLNVLLGASTGSAMSSGDAGGYLLGYPPIVIWVAVAIGVLITGATLLGRNEAVENQTRLPLVIAGGLIVVALLGLVLAPFVVKLNVELTDRQAIIFSLFMSLVSITMVRRVIEAIAFAQPRPIQIAVVSVLRSLIAIDAAICCLAMPGQVFFAVVVLALLVPSITLGKVIPST